MLHDTIWHNACQHRTLSKNNMIRFCTNQALQTHWNIWAHIHERKSESNSHHSYKFPCKRTYTQTVNECIRTQRTLAHFSASSRWTWTSHRQHSGISYTAENIHNTDVIISQIIMVNCGIRHVTVPIATRILIANVRHIGLSNICVINLVYFKMQVWCLWNRYKATVMLNCSQYGASRLK